MVRYKFCVAMAICVSLAVSSSAATDFSINLKTRSINPSPVKSLAARASALVDQHVILQLDHPLTKFERDFLSDQGVNLLDYISNFAFIATLDRSLTNSELNNLGIRWLDRFEPTDKISPAITDHGIFDWARRGSDQVAFTVVLHGDVDLDQWIVRLAVEFDAEILHSATLSNTIEIVMSEFDINRLAEEDAILWIEQAPPPPEEHNDNSRISTGASVLQAAPFNLDGTGVMVAEWDGGLVDDVHADLGRNVLHGEVEPLGDHATHVAGTVIGTGAESLGLYKGMAPKAKIISYLWWFGSGTLQLKYNAAINVYGARVSTNSWGLGVGSPATEGACLSLMGAYRAECATLDNVIRGDLGAPISVCWSAGNQRSGSSSQCGSLGWTYGTVSPYGTAKNIITVGAMNSNNNAMTSFSSWGPCQDGRLKPDVIGPGCQSDADHGVTSCRLGGGYSVKCGTSMSCPAVAGTIALMYQYFDDNFPGDTVLPSTIKAILIASAEDLGNPGPDYGNGHGKVDGVAAINKIGTDSLSYLTAEISSGETHVYEITVPSGSPFKVALVWDDPGGSTVAASAIVNDLDLALIDPFGNEVLAQVLDPNNPSAVATNGLDRVNNVETIGFDPPLPGLWKARVTGFNIPNGPQTYSLAFTPDGIHLPGNTMALAVFNELNIDAAPGDTIDAEFWVSNVGLAIDSVNISIGDNVGWLLSTKDTSAVLAPFDSVFFSLKAVVPDSSLAGDHDSILCVVTSKTDSNIVSVGRLILSATAYYDVNIAVPADDTVRSPETYAFMLDVSNLGNASNFFTIDPISLIGWTISPGLLNVSIPPMTDTSFNFTMFIPAEVIHLTQDIISFNVTSSGGAFDSGSFTATVDNPLMPPQLIAPAPHLYTNETNPGFVWSGTGSTYSLHIATDTAMINIVREYFALGDTAHTLPAADSLPDGKYFWGARQYAGVDSSSLPKSSFKFIVDNLEPLAVKPNYPNSGLFVGLSNFLYLFGLDIKSANVAGSPEYFRIELSADSNFSGSVLAYEPIPTTAFVMPDTVAEGNWYWRVQSLDSAGNSAPMSGFEPFILDTQAPAMPTRLVPVQGDTVRDASPVLKWSTEPPPPFPESPESYVIQLSTDSQFFVVAYSTSSSADSVVVPDTELSTAQFYYWRVRGQDSLGHSSSYQSDPYGFYYLTFICGNFDGLGTEPDIADLTYLVSFMFGGGPPVVPPIAGSVNCDTEIDIADLTYIVAYMFGGGPPPCCQ